MSRKKNECIGFDNYNFVPTGQISNTHIASESGTRRSPYVFIKKCEKDNDELPRQDRPTDGE